MRRKRRNHSPEFKAKVALAAIQGDLTMAELVKKFDVHANQITEWKRQLVGNADQVFGRSEKQAEENEHKVKELHAKIGQLTMERDFSYGLFLQTGRKYTSPVVINVDSDRTISVAQRTGLVSTMDQAHIRGLVTAFHTSVAGLPRS